MRVAKPQQRGKQTTFEPSNKKAREKKMSWYSKENVPKQTEPQKRVARVGHQKEKENEKEEEPPYDCCVKTKFGYKIQFTPVPKPQKTPYEELLKKYKVYELRVKEALKQQKVFRIISAYDVPTVRRVRMTV